MISHQQVTTARGSCAILCDSISFVTENDAGEYIVCASHGGVSSGEYAARFPLGLVIFNDAGIGKDSAGIQALGTLQDRGIAACAVSHQTARIGDAEDHWWNGVISHVNPNASQEISVGMSVQRAVEVWDQSVSSSIH
ncbi:hypothetical protein [Nesterenkonia muleiensis]|uniref:hypothetical protein n=1 Tax=Nesterenkonia muleiensis TaxID=2282648 RepID=UPI000E73FCFE|nr:hypothetical protein [Nesterenkonia muleiensis]